MSLDACSFHCTIHSSQTGLGEGSMVNRDNNKGLGDRCVDQREENPEPDAAEQSTDRRKNQQALRF